MICEISILIISLILVYYFFFEFRETNLPPGPKPWPLIGNINLLGKHLHLSLDSLSKIYGNVYRVYIGDTLVIVLAGDAIKEAMVRKPVEFGGRPWTVSFDIALRGEKPLVFMDYGPFVKLYRKLGHRALKVYSQDRYQQVISCEANELCQRIGQSQDGVVDMKQEFGLCIMNVICAKIFGNRYEVSDVELREILRIHERLFSLTTVAGQSIVDLFPVLRFVLPVYGNTKELQQIHDEWQILLQKKFKEVLATFDREHVRHFTDALLMAKYEAELENNADRKFLEDDKNLINAISTIFIAGSETTATSLTWAIVYLIHFPKYQDTIHETLVSNSKEKCPNLDSRKKFPLLEAFISELLRITSLLPLGVPHKTLTDTTFRGYLIPQGTTVLANLWSLHHDPCIWGDPHVFRPERFLNGDGTLSLDAMEVLLPFGAGPRTCMGEVLARAELFLILSRLLRDFKFEMPPEVELPPLEPATGSAVLQPSLPLVTVIRRFDGAGEHAAV